MEMENKSEKGQRKLPSKKILELFKVLAEGNDNERIKATETLLDFLKTQQSANEKGLCDDVKYTVNRLVQGLSSDRKFARIGYSAALSQLLRTFDQIHGKDVLKSIEENCSKNVKEDRSSNLGKVFGFLTLVNSGKVLSSSGELSQIVEELLNLHEKKTYLQLPCVDGIVQIITQVSHDVFKQSVLPHLEKYFTEGWDGCTPEMFLLVLVSSRHHMAVIKNLLKEHWKDEHLVSEKNFTKLADLLSKCASQVQAVHPAVDQILDIVKEKQLSIEKFWNQSCKHLLVTERRVRTRTKQTLGLYIFKKILPHINSPEKVNEIIQKGHMARFFIQLCSNEGEEGTKGAKKTGDIIKKAKSTLTELATVMADSKDGKLQIAMLKSLIIKPGSHDFDNITKTNTLSKILSQLMPEAKRELLEELMKGFVGQPSWIVSEKFSPFLTRWCARQLCFLCTHAETSWQLKVLQFLFMHSFFNIKKNNKELPHCTVVDPEMTEFQRKAASDSFFKILTKILTKHDLGVPKAVNLNQRVDLLFDLSEYVQRLLQAEDCVQIVKAEHQPKIVEEWDRLVSVIGTINNKRNKDQVLDGHAFELLFIFFGLQMFEDPENIQESLEDLHVCYKKSTKRRMSVAKDEGPPWIDVITELLLSLMFKENSSSRIVAKQVMTFLTDHVTNSSVQLIVDALVQTSSDGENGMVAVEDDDADGNGDGDGNKDADNDENMSDDGNSSSEEDDDDDESEDSGIEEEKDVVVEDKLKEKVRLALGDAAGNPDEKDDDDDDENDEGEVEFSDSEMMKLDNVLAAAFKSMTNDKKKMDKKKHKQILDFKLRVLDLVEALVRSHLSPDIAKGFIFPLMNIADQSVRKQEEENLSNRAQATLRMLLKHKPEVKTDAEVDKDGLLELLENLMKRSKKVLVPSFTQDVGSACLYVLKLLLAESNPSPLKTRAKADRKQKKPGLYKDKVQAMLQSAISDFLTNKTGHCQPAFFHMVIDKYPLIFWPSRQDLINTVQTKSAKVFCRTQAAAFLVKMINKELLDSVGEDDWNNFVRRWKPVATEVISDMEVEKNFRKNLLEEVVTVCQQIEHTSPGKLMLEEEILQKLLGMKKKCNKATKKAINKLTLGIERSVIPKEGSGKGKKRKEDENDMENQLPQKKTKLENQSVSAETENLEKENKPINVSEPTTVSSNKQKKKKKKMRKAEQQVTENGETPVSQSVSNGDVGINSTVSESLNENVEVENDKEMEEEMPKSDKKKKKHVIESLNKTVEVENDKEMEEQIPKSDKKKRRRKSKISLSDDDANDVIAETVEPVRAPQSAKKAKLNLATGIENQSTESDVSILNQSKNEPGSGKKKKKKQK